MCTALIYGVFFAALMCGVLLNTEKLLLLFGQDPDVARYDTCRRHTVCACSRESLSHYLIDITIVLCW